MITESELYIINNFINGEKQFESDWFIKEANKLIKKKLNIPIRTNYEKLKHDRLIKRVDLLLDKKLYIKEVKHIFDRIGKISITKNDIYDLETKDYEYYGDYREIFYDIINIIKDDEITYNELEPKINDDDWLHFQIRNFYKLLQHNNKLPRLAEIKELIGKWCKKKLNDPMFSLTMNKNGISVDPKLQYTLFFWYFVKNNYYACNENVLLDLLSFDSVEGSSYSGIKYIEEKIPFDKIHDRILSNLQKGIEVEIIYENHLDFCMRHNISEATEYAFRILTAVEWSEYLKRKALACILYFKNNEDTAEFLIKNVDKQFRWNVFDSIEKYTELLINELTKILNNDEDSEKLKAANRLIKLNQLNGFEYVVNLIISSKSAKSYNIRGTYFNTFTNKEALPLLYKLIAVCYSNDFIDAHHYSIKHDIFGIIKNIIANNNILDEVITKLNNIIERNKETIPEITNINYSIKDITDFYYQVKSENILIDEAIQLVEELN